MSTYSDEELAYACSETPEAIGELFLRFQAPVSRYLSRSIPATDEIDDLLQSVFLEVIRGKTRYDGRAKVSTWLLAIANNKLRHHRRSYRRRMRKFAKAQLQQTRTAHHYTEHHSELSKVDARSKLLRATLALQSLAPKLRDAFILCELEGLSAKEVGQILNTSEEAVWKRLSKARKQLRSQVELD